MSRSVLAAAAGRSRSLALVAAAATRAGAARLARRRPRRDAARRSPAGTSTCAPTSRACRRARAASREGQEVWDAKCASCHGTFGESNELHADRGGVGDDSAGRRSRSARPAATLMKLTPTRRSGTTSTARCRWNAPKTLTTDEVYALTAYVLHLGDIVPADFVLSTAIDRRGRRMPNRNGFTTRPRPLGRDGKPDIAQRGLHEGLRRRGARRLAAARLRARRARQPRRAERGRSAPARRRARPPRRAQAAGDRAADLAERARASARPATRATASTSASSGPSFREVAAQLRGRRGAEARLAGEAPRGRRGRLGADPDAAAAAAQRGRRAALVQWILGGRAVSYRERPG